MSGLHLNQYGPTQLLTNFSYTWEFAWKIILEEKSYEFSKNVKKYLKCSIANTDRPIISKTNCLEDNLNDANRSFENNK